MAQKLAIGYIRVSLAREEMISPEIQRATIKSWAARNSRRIVEWVEDLDRTGRNFKRRVVDAIAKIEQKKADEIIVYRYDRWGRNAVESLANVKRVEVAGGSLQSATEPMDVETAIGRYNRTNAFAIAEMYSDIIGDNWRAAHKARIERGLPAQGTRRFGYVRLGKVLDEFSPIQHKYRRDPNDEQGERYEPDYESGAADMVAEMYELYIGGLGYKEIAQILNLRGYRTTRGKEWSIATVRRFLDSGFAAGYLRVHDETCKCRDAINCRNKIYIKGAHPPIIGDETWQRYLARRRERTRMPPRVRTPRYPLTGLVRCGQCGASMIALSGGRGKAGWNYICGRRKNGQGCSGVIVLRSRAEAAVLDRLREIVDELERARADVQVALSRPQRSPADERRRLQRELADVDAALRRLAIQRATDTAMPDDIYAAARDELLERRERLERAVAELEASPEIDAGRAEPVMHRLIDDWDIIPVRRRNELLRSVIRHVLVYRHGSGSRIAVRMRWEPCECVLCSAT